MKLLRIYSAKTKHDYYRNISKEDIVDNKKLENC